MRIYKYEVNAGTIKAPILQVLDVQMQDGRPVMWALIDENALQRTVEFVIYWTGQDINREVLKEFEYFKTLQDDMGLVWHVFIKR